MSRIVFHLRLGTALLLAVASLGELPAGGAEAPPPAEPRPAKLKVSGYGPLGNLQLKRMLRILQQDGTRPRAFDANYIEDAALLLISRLEKDGFLRPVVTAELELDDGRRLSYVWNESIEDPLPRPLAARVAHFKIREGPLHHIKRLEFSGLTVIPEKRARAYFVESGGLLTLKQNRIYTPDAFRRSVANLNDQLKRLGYQNATVTATNLWIDSKSGRVDVLIAVNEGPRFIARTVLREVFFGTNSEPQELHTFEPNEPFSRIWEQDFSQQVRSNYYRRGYPDAAVTITATNRTAETNEIGLDLVATVKTGPRVWVGDIGFTGNRRTRPAVLERRLPLEEGDLLDRIRAERGRYRLSRLGVFDSVELRYDVVDEDTRNITYVLEEGKQIDVSLLFGYGSYELLRGGVQLDQYNVFGRGHHQRLKAIQSFKASNAEYLYTLPEFFGENMDVFITGSGLRREEVSFTRLEFGGAAGIRKYLRRFKTDFSSRYSYQVLEAQDADPDLEEVGVRNSRAAAIITDLNHDRRDNPLYPRQGYKVFANLEIASDVLGGDVNYQRFDVSGACHWPVTDAHWVHLGLSHGFVAAIGSTREDLPFNRRFFPGGENSIRGYQEGEAAPRNEEGKIVGAEAYLLGNLEFEQGITPRWSLVAFVDGLGFGEQLQDYPGDEWLVSVGGGLRWKTFIGPVRVEYGHNLNPRRRDPTGTLHFSLGFPF